MGAAGTATGIDREAASEFYRKNRESTVLLFDSVRPDAYYDRPIALRNPICFYEGHLPAFSVNTLIKRGLKERGVDERYEVLFERGIDPEDEPGAGAGSTWPSREEILDYAARADRRVLEALERKDVEREDDPVLRRALAVYTILEHEPMHQETLRYMWHRLPYEKKIAPDADAASPVVGGEPPARETVDVPAGIATLGTSREHPFGWDNEFPEHPVEVPAFVIDAYPVTNRDFLEFVEAGGYDRRELWMEEDWHWREKSGTRHPLFWERNGAGWTWRGMFARVPLPAAWPVYVSQAEAQAFARWRGARLPTEAEFHRAAFGDPSGGERLHPWGDDPPDETRGNFDFRRPDPVPVGSFHAGDSGWGVHELVGNGWEWTSTIFAGFRGFEPMPSYPVYSSDFFDGKHYVLKGASPATSAALVRRGFRNWFRGNYPYVYAKFRTVR